MVLMIVNNQWAISVPRKKQSQGRTLAQKGIAGGLPSIQVDGNDYIAVYTAVKSALKRAYEGKGASVIEAITYRLSDHTTADDASRYRPNDEVENARQFEPISRMKKYLTSQGQWNEQLENQLQNTCKIEVDAAVEEYQNASPLGVADMFDYMYAELPHDLAAQKAYAQAMEEKSNG